MSKTRVLTNRSRANIVERCLRDNHGRFQGTISIKNNGDTRKMCVRLVGERRNNTIRVYDQNTGWRTINLCTVSVINCGKDSRHFNFTDSAS